MERSAKIRIATSSKVQPADSSVTYLIMKVLNLNLSKIVIHDQMILKASIHAEARDEEDGKEEKDEVQEKAEKKKMSLCKV